MTDLPEFCYRCKQPGEKGISIQQCIILTGLLAGADGCEDWWPKPDALMKDSGGAGKWMR